jgi:hypothetical protein
MHIDMAKARSAGIDRINSSFHATFKFIPPAKALELSRIPLKSNSN